MGKTNGNIGCFCPWNNSGTRKTLDALLCEATPLPSQHRNLRPSRLYGQFHQSNICHGCPQQLLLPLISRNFQTRPKQQWTTMDWCHEPTGDPSCLHHLSFVWWTRWTPPFRFFFNRADLADGWQWMTTYDNGCAVTERQPVATWHSRTVHSTNMASESKVSGSPSNAGPTTGRIRHPCNMFLRVSTGLFAERLRCKGRLHSTDNKGRTEGTLTWTDVTWTLGCTGETGFLKLLYTVLWKFDICVEEVVSLYNEPQIPSDDAFRAAVHSRDSKAKLRFEWIWSDQIKKNHDLFNADFHFENVLFNRICLMRHEKPWLSQRPLSS